MYSPSLAPTTPRGELKYSTTPFMESSLRGLVDEVANGKGRCLADDGERHVSNANFRRACVTLKKIQIPAATPYATITGPETYQLSGFCL